MIQLPALTTPAELAAHLGVSERTVRDRARAIGACRLIGKKTLMTEGDVALFMEAGKPCPSKSTSAARSGIIEAPLRGGDYADLQKRLTGKPRNASKPRSKQKPGAVTLMGRGQG